MSNSEKNLLDKLVNFLKLGLPVGLTYYIKQGISVTNQVLVKDIIRAEGEDELVLANGALIPFSKVIRIEFPKAPERSQRKPFSEQEIFKFQLPNWTGL